MSLSSLAVLAGLSLATPPDMGMSGAGVPAPASVEAASTQTSPAASRPILLDFYADWCGPCRQMQGALAQLEAQGFEVRRVNIDRERALAQRFRITSIPAFVVVLDGREVQRTVGVTSAARLQQMILAATPPPQAAGVGCEAVATAAPSAAPPEGARVAATPAALSRPAPTRAAPVVPPPGSGGLENDPRTVVRANDSGVNEGAPDSAWGEPAATAVAATNRAASPIAAAIQRDLLPASVRLRVQEEGGTAYASGTIVYSVPGRAIVMTCGHVFRNARGRDMLAVDVYTPQGRRSYPGHVIAYDLEADVGLVQIAPGEALPSVPVAPPGYTVPEGEQVVSIGCSRGDAPSPQQVSVTALNRYLGPANIECSGLPVQGRSGGGLFSDDGYLVGVCVAADPQDQRGLYAGLEALQDELDEENLVALYDPSRRGGAPFSPTLSPDAGGGSVAAADQRSSGTVPAHLAQGTTMADLEQFLDEAGEAEVVCVIRSLSDPRARSRVVVLDRASEAFLAQLAMEQAVQAERHVTSYSMPEHTLQTAVLVVPYNAAEPLRASAASAR